MKIIYIGFILRVILANINIHVPLPGGEFDAISFHEDAQVYLEYLNGNVSEYEYKLGWLYSVFLGLVYFISVDSMTIAALLSCVAWLLSAIFFRAIMIKLKFNEKGILFGLFFYTYIFPIAFVYSTFMLREVYILLFINMLVLSIVQFLLTKKNIDKFYNVVLFFLSITLLILFHKAHIIFSALFFIFLLFYYLIDKLKWKIINLEIIVLIAGISYLISYYNIPEYLFDTIYGYQEGHFDRFAPARANYVIPDSYLYLSYSFTELFNLLGKNIFNYFVQPTVYRASNFIDLVAMYENMSRLLIILLCTIKIFTKFDNKKIFIIIFSILLILEVIYAQATINWGSASRHHMPVYGLLFLMLFFPIRNK